MKLFYLLATILLSSPSLIVVDATDFIYTDAAASFPAAVAVHKSRDIYFAEFFASFVKKLDYVTGKITTVAGNGTSGYNGDDILSTDASLNGPHSLAFDKLGKNLYIAEYFGNRIRMIDLKTNVITTVAGTGTAGYNGDSMAATMAQITTPSGVVLDDDDNIYIADFGNNRVRVVYSRTKMIRTFAGTGIKGTYGDGVTATTAEFNGPYSLAVNYGASTEIYIAESLNNLIRKVNVVSNIITVVANENTTDFNGVATVGPRMITMDKGGNLFYSDFLNNVVKRIDTSNKVHLLAGSGDTVFNGDPHEAATAALNGPLAVTHDTDGNIYITEFLGGRIRHVTRNGSLPPTPSPTSSLAKCPAGYYLHTPRKCKPCPPGMWSTAGAATCTACPAGTHTSNHLSCEDCKSGEYSEAMWKECKFCGVGTVSKGKASVCTVCPEGTYAHHQDNECLPCAQYYWSKPMSDYCTVIEVM